jgi:hypothetical protein
MLTSRMRMESTPRTGSMATARAATMLRSGEIRPMTRRTRTACRLVARLRDWPGAMTRARETATTRASKRFQGLRTNGRYQWARALTASSSAKAATKKRSRRSRRDASAGSLDPAMSWVSTMVEMKFCRRAPWLWRG